MKNGFVDLKIIFGFLILLKQIMQCCNLEIYSDLPGVSYVADEC